MDISNYSQEAILTYALVNDKFDAFISCLNHLKSTNDRFAFFCIDIGVTTAFGEKVFEYKDKIKKLAGKNYFGIFSFTPSAYMPPEFILRNYLSESLSNTFFMTGGTNVCLEI
ncbi:hypothetical protein [Candidatus Methanoperedens nitratireducens]|uniref:Uncharacterized protein n=1 Tax=Candidatus Methanoperedens nitratireducens TaxID=1392998 RepID=A0A284VTA8_9EURY|nr:hypothetical protein [Candidatus Methanoperedens nitroreducens]SNQ62502.1 hypothetical protein MNV_750017 [Candidatus Methanoperedens nitroreducens]